MKFFAKMDLSTGEFGGELLTAFFKDFHPESSIYIKGGKATLEVVFDETPPMEIISVIGNNYSSFVDQPDFEFIYGEVPSEEKAEEIFAKGTVEKLAEKSEEEEKVVISATSVSDESKVGSEDNGEGSSTPEEAIEDESSATTKITEVKHKSRKSKNKEIEDSSEEASKNKRKGYKRTYREMNIGEVPEIDALANEAVSFDDFIVKVAKWLNMNKKENLFIQLAKAATELEIIDWKALWSLVSFSNSDQNILTAKVAKVFKASENAVSILEVFRYIVLYKNFEFHAEPSENVASQNPYFREKFGCLNEIGDFQNIIFSIDKTRTIDLRVDYFLKSMGASTHLTYDEELSIREIVTTAMKQKNIDLEDILTKCEVLPENHEEIIMQISTFLHTYIAGHNVDEKVRLIRVIDFLEALQDVLLSDEEKADLS